MNQLRLTMKILVRNLSRKMTQQNIHELFSEFGDIEDCTLVMDKETGKSKGFAFVEMPYDDEAKAAIKGLNQTELDGSRIRVKKAD
jgi:RNA recognition motif-containing protein